MKAANREKEGVTEAELVHNKSLRWKLCRIINDKFYSLYNVGYAYEAKNVEECMRNGLVMEYAPGKTNVPTFCGIYTFYDLHSLHSEFRHWCGMPPLGLVVGHGPRMRKKGLHLSSSIWFKEWRGTPDQVKRARDCFAKLEIPGLCVMDSFTPLWFCRNYFRPKVIEPGSLTFERM